MTFEEMIRSNDDSISGSDVGIREGAPMLRVVRSVEARPEKIQRPMPNHPKSIGEGSDCLHDVSWSSDVRARRAARQQESVPRLLLTTTKSPDRDSKNLQLGGRFTTNWRCD
jgi:hypothetical protein